MSTLGFDNYVEPLKLYLQKYRETMKGDKQPGEGEFEGLQEDMLGRECRAAKMAKLHGQDVQYISLPVPQDIKAYKYSDLGISNP